MQMSIGVEYAFHSLFYMINLKTGTTVGVKELAALHQLPESYLSKVFTKLRKAGIVRSIQGVHGGYELAKPPTAISFFDIVEAVEGSSYLFQCAEIRQNNRLPGATQTAINCPCLIKTVMLQAEDQMRHYLRERSLAWLHEEASKQFSEERTNAIRDWLQTVTNK